MKRILLPLLAAVVSMAPGAAAADRKIPVMILTGEQGGPYHAWEETTPYLQRMLEETGLFEVTVVVAPPKDGDFSKFRPDWSKYRAVVGNYDAPDERWPDDLKASFEAYVRNGGGFVAVHAADNAFPNWREYNLMIGIGGWRGRTEKHGPYWYVKDGKVVSDPAPGPAGSHGARLPFRIRNFVKDHPVTRGLPEEWMHVADELYAHLRGPGQNMTMLSVAYSDPSNRGTGREEPILMAIEYGKGRVFHTTLGHDIAAMNCVGFITTFQRGVEWAATGKVTQRVPPDFPTATETRTRPEYNPPPGWVSPPAPRRPQPPKQ